MLATPFRLTALYSAAATLSLLSFVGAAQVAATPATAFPLEHQAMKAYDARQYAESAHLFDAAFAAGLNRSDDAYNAACSDALAGNASGALAYLDRAIRLGFHDAEHIKVDGDLTSLHGNPQFATLVDRATAASKAYEVAHHDPDRAAIITSDIDLFWNAYARLKTTPTPEEVLENEYLLRGSPGLQDFTALRIESGSALYKTIDHAPKYYASLAPQTLRIKEFSPRIHASFRKLQHLYPDATFPDVYFLIGRMNSAGTTGPSGLLSGAEMFGRSPNVPMDELSEWHRMNLKPVDSIPYVVAHELIHYQQHTPQSTLLEMAIHEGTADFLGEMISGGTTNPVQYQYGIAHEEELWQQFQKEMNGKDTSHWLYEGKTINGRPADMGYFMGHRIAQAFYEQASNKKKAIRDILNFKDADKFLADSSYVTKPKSKPAT